MKLLAFLLALGLTAGCGGNSGGDGQGGRGGPAQDNSPECDGVKVRIRFTACGQATYTDDRITSDWGLWVLVNAGNTNQNRPARLQGWNHGAERPYLVDNFGNRYRLAPLPRGVGLEHWGNHKARSVVAASIQPGEEITDVLWFERPVKTATRLELWLPRANLGGSGWMRIDIDPEKVQFFRGPR